MPDPFFSPQRWGTSSSRSVLERLQTSDSTIRVAIIGAGSMGKGLQFQCHNTPGIECVALADTKIERAIACAEGTRQNYRVVDTLEGMHEAIRQGLLAVCEDGDLPARCELADVLVESSNAVAEAVQYAVTAIKHKKHLVLMNAECDLVFGPYLLNLAKENDVTYTSCDGDQHGVIARVIDDARLWGFEIVMAGNIKGFLNRYSNPATIIPEADKRNLDYRMASGYTDGTKLCIEMALVANAYGLETTRPGMLGPEARRVQDVFSVYDFPEIRKRHPGGCVDYILGAEPGGGIFVVGFCTNEYQRSMLSYYKMGNGPYYLFYRPYHLCHIESMNCIADAVVHRRSLLQPDCGFRTNVYAYAKHELKAGDILDGIGGYACYGLIENNNSGRHAGLPICLAEDVKLVRDVPKDRPVLWSDIEDNRQRIDFQLYEKALSLSYPYRDPSPLQSADIASSCTSPK